MEPSKNQFVVRFAFGLLGVGGFSEGLNGVSATGETDPG